MFWDYIRAKRARNLIFKSLILGSIGFVGHVAAIEPARYDAGGIGLTPTLEVGEAYDDNVLDAPEGKESMVTTIAPSLMLDALDGLNYYQIKYRLLREEIHSSQEDSHTDHDVSGRARIELNARNRLDFTAAYKEETERRDEQNRANDETGNESNRFDTGVKYGFGAKSAMAQLELGAKYGELRFDNNFNSGSFTREQEYDETDLNAIFYYRLGGKTRVLTEVFMKDYDYELSSSLLSSESDIYRAGLEWDATAKTTGRISVGREHKDFDEGSSVSNTSWAASITWQPRTYSTFTLISSSRIDEGSATEAYVEVDSVDLTWRHNWSKKISSQIGYGFKNEDFKGLSNSGREDETDTINLGMDYELRRWADLGWYYKYNNTDSNDPASDYDRNVFGLRVKMSL